jgi:hypothetical protein
MFNLGGAIPENQRHQISKQADKELWNNFSTFIAFGIGIEIGRTFSLRLNQ